MVRLNARRLFVEQSAIAASLRSGDNAQVPGNNLLFIDANIWLDFYRARNEASLKLLSHAESLIDRIIVTYQLESEFKKNRQSAIVEGLQAPKDRVDIPRLGIFSNSKATRVIDQSTKRAKLRPWRFGEAHEGIHCRSRKSVCGCHTADPPYSMSYLEASREGKESRRQKEAAKLIRTHPSAVTC